MRNTSVNVKVQHEESINGYDYGYDLCIKRRSHTIVAGELTVEDLRTIRDAVAEAIYRIEEGFL